MYVSQPPRAVSAALSLGLTAAIVMLLVLGGAMSGGHRAVPGLISVDLREAPPPPRPKERPIERKADKAAPKDAPGMRNLENKATAVVAPPVIPLIVPPPVTTAPVADIGSAAQTGASPVPGPGRGAGSYGNGLGGGGTGGDGDGSGGGEAVRGPRQIGGRIAFRDLPEGVLSEGQEAAVSVVFLVRPDGGVEDCEIERSSGVRAIDTLTCRLIEQRFRFRPAVDRRGRPVRAYVGETHTWYASPE